MTELIKNEYNMYAELVKKETTELVKKTCEKGMTELYKVGLV